MFKRQQIQKSSIQTNKCYEGQSIEDRVELIVNNGESITDGAPTIYTARSEGVQPAYDVRTDRWDVAIDGMDYVSKSRVAQREERGKVVKMDNKSGETPADSGTKE